MSPRIFHVKQIAKCSKSGEKRSSTLVLERTWKRGKEIPVVDKSSARDKIVLGIL